MAVKISDALANAMLDALETFTGTAAKFQIWSGTIPADETAAPAGAKLVEMTLPSDWMNNAGSGIKTKLGTWSAPASLAGTATFFRLCTSAGTSVFQGSLSISGSNWAITTAYTLGQRVVANGNVYVCSQAGTSAGSGSGPTGTGSAIVDNTVRWDYVSALGDATIDNTNISVGQTVTVTSFQLTAPHL